MDCTEIRVDMREMTHEERAEMGRMTRLIYELNHTPPMTEEYSKILKELFGERLGAMSVVTKDVPDYAVAVGNPAKVVKTLDEDKFN